jgi:hypothetical protein
MRVKVLVVIAIVRVKREVCGRFTPGGVRRERLSLALGYLWWDVGAISLPEPDLDAIVSRSRHDVVSATIEVKRRAVGATVEEDATP